MVNPIWSAKTFPHWGSLETSFCES